MRAVVYRELGAVPIGYDAAGGPVLIGRSAPYRRLARGRARGRRDLRPPLCGRHRVRDTSFHPRGGAFPYSGRGRTRRRSARGRRGLVRQGDALQAGPPSRTRPCCATSRSNGSTSRRARSSAASAAANRSRCPAGTARRADRRPHPLIRSDIRRTAFSMQRPIRKSTATYALGPGRTRNHPCCNVSQQG